MAEVCTETHRPDLLPAACYAESGSLVRYRVNQALRRTPLKDKQVLRSTFEPPHSSDVLAFQQTQSKECKKEQQECGSDDQFQLAAGQRRHSVRLPDKATCPITAIASIFRRNDEASMKNIAMDAICTGWRGPG